MAKARLVLLPGLLNDELLWQHQIDGLVDIADAQVEILDRHDSMAALADAVLAAAPPRFALCGLSMGGYCALEIMRRAPERVERLALLDTSARADIPEATENRKRLMELAGTDFAAVVEELSHKLLHPRHRQSEAIFSIYRSMAEKIGPQRFVTEQRAIMSRIDSRPHLGSIRCPTLVLCGREDSVTPVEIHEEIASGVLGSRLVVIEDCGHLAPIEQPARVTAALRDWLLAG